jgi:hypothetical protein
MKLSNQNIYNLQGCKNFGGQCQMPLGGVQIISGGVHPQKIRACKAVLSIRIDYVTSTIMPEQL